MANVPPKVAQTLMRHSTITLTMDRYSHVGLYDTAGVLERLPPIPGQASASEPASQQATGTDGQRINGRFATHLPLAGDGSRRDLSHAGGSSEATPGIGGCCNSREMSGLDASGRDPSCADASSGGGTRTPDTRIMIPLL